MKRSCVNVKQNSWCENQVKKTIFKKIDYISNCSSSYFKHWNSMMIDQVTWLRNFTIIPRMFINPYSKYSNPTQNMASSRFFQVAATSNLNSSAKYRILYHTILVLSTITSWHKILSVPLKSDFKNKGKIISRKDIFA